METGKLDTFVVDRDFLAIAQIKIVPHDAACIFGEERAPSAIVLKFQRDRTTIGRGTNKHVALFTPRLDKHSEKAMTKLRTACLMAMMFVATTTFASAQGGSTDRNGNAIGSEHVGNGGGTMGGMSGPATGTTGMNTRRSQRDSPNGSPGAAPKAHGGPANGDASQKESAPR